LARDLAVRDYLDLVENLDLASAAWSPSVPPPKVFNAFLLKDYDLCSETTLAASSLNLSLAG